MLEITLKMWILGRDDVEYAKMESSLDVGGAFGHDLSSSSTSSIVSDRRTSNVSLWQPSATWTSRAPPEAQAKLGGRGEPRLPGRAITPPANIHNEAANGDEVGEEHCGVWCIGWALGISECIDEWCESIWVLLGRGGNEIYIKWFFLIRAKVTKQRTMEGTSQRMYEVFIWNMKPAPLQRCSNYADL